MRSLIILEVEHDEDVPVSRAVDDCIKVIDCSEYRATVNDYTVRLDVPECFRLDN